MTRWLVAFGAQERGSIAVTTGLLLTVIIGFAALAVDLGAVFTERRKAQGTTDLAALAAVSDIANASKAAEATIRRNNHAPGTSHALQLGVYSPDPALSPSKRFSVAKAGAAANAAQVTVTTTAPLFFGRVITGRDHFDIQTTATAARSSFASFAIGSRLLKVDGGLLNQLLGQLLGSSLSLSAMDYQALLDARVDLFNYLDAVAIKAGLTAISYDRLLDSNVTIGQAMDALVDTERGVYGSNNAAVRALGDVAQSVKGASTKVRVGSIVDVGPYRSMQTGQHPKAAVTAGALDMVTAMAQLANRQNQVQVALDVKIPGITSASLKLAIGERPQGKSWITIGAEGATVHTAQTRLLLIVQLAGAAPVGQVQLPIYIEMASATARLNAINCGFPSVTTSRVTLGVTPAVVDAWIGDVSNAQFVNFSVTPNPTAAMLVDTPSIKVTGRSNVAMTNMVPQQVDFSYSDILQQTKKTVSTRDFLSSLLSRLVGNAQLSATVVGLGLGFPSAITKTTSAILSGAVSPIDQLLSSVLTTLGVGLGQVDVWVTGVRCDGAVLVN
jgi:uncharacterized membrane protein